MSQKKFNRKSIRKKGFDYLQEGLYFITICCKDMKCCFGEVVNGEMKWNAAGNIANECWLDIPKHFPHAVLHEFVVMPNHVHGIIELMPIPVGANNHSPNEPNENNHSPRLPISNNHSPNEPNENNHSPHLPISNNHSPNEPNENNHSPHIPISNNHSPNEPNENNHSPRLPISNNHSPNEPNENNHSPHLPILNNHSPLRSPSKTIGSIVRGFKIGVTKWMRQNTDVHDVWQRNYYDIIIRNDLSYHRISEYIINNPKKWDMDKFYKKKLI